MLRSIARRRSATTTAITRAFASSTASTSSPTTGDNDNNIPINALSADIQGKVITTRIVAVDRRNGVAHATTGLRAPTTYRLDELPENVAVGDVVEAKVTWMNNPLRELDLEVKGLAAAKRKERAWRELLEARDGGKSVKGRILNAVNGGYAVGIAGLIAFLPSRAYRGKGEPRTAERALRDALENAGGSGGAGDVAAPIVGDLLTFKILKMTSSGETYRNVVVTGPIGGNAGERRRAASAKETRARTWKPRGGKGKAAAVGGDGESMSENDDDGESDGDHVVEGEDEAEEKP